MNDGGSCFILSRNKVLFKEKELRFSVKNWQSNRNKFILGLTAKSII